MVITGKDQSLQFAGSLLFIEREICNVYYGEKHNYNLLKLWRYYHEKVSGYYCCTRCDYRC